MNYMLIATYRLVRVKEKTKAYTEKAKNTKQSVIQVGDQVLVKDKQTNCPHHSIQCNPKWLARLATVLFIETPCGTQYSRNTSHVEKFGIDDPASTFETQSVSQMKLEYLQKNQDELQVN